MRASIKTTDTGNVVLAYDYDDPCEEGTPRVTREFMVREEGGYVREWNPSTEEWEQICDRLGSRGPTLKASSRAELEDVIRREYRALKRAMKRD